MTQMFFYYTPEDRATSCYHKTTSMRRGFPFVFLFLMAGTLIVYH